MKSKNLLGIVCIPLLSVMVIFLAAWAYTSRQNSATEPIITTKTNDAFLRHGLAEDVASLEKTLLPFTPQIIETARKWQESMGIGGGAPDSFVRQCLFASSFKEVNRQPGYKTFYTIFVPGLQQEFDLLGTEGATLLLFKPTTGKNFHISANRYDEGNNEANIP